MPPSNDLMFKNLFGVQERDYLVKDFLHKLLKLDNDYLEDLEIVNSVKLDKETIENKHFEMDVLIRFKNGDKIDLEMQNVYDTDAELKSLLYITGSFYKVLKSGENYKNIPKVKGITIAKDLKLHKNNKQIQRYFLTNEDDINDKIAPDEFCMMIVSLEQACEYLDDEFEGWRRFFASNTLEEMEKASEYDEIIKKASEENIRFMGLDYVQSYEYDEREKKNRERRHIEEAVKEAKNEGIAQGEKNKAYEIAKNLLKTNTPIEVIVSCTGLTKEEVENLK